LASEHRGFSDDLSAMCQGPDVASSSASAACGSDSGEFDTHVSPAEEQLTSQVPVLLDAMNRASAEANSLELRVGDAQRCYKTQLAEWSKLYDDLRVTQGHAFARVKPYYFASQELKATSHHVQSVAREFSEASIQHSHAVEAQNSFEEARLKEERDRLEKTYVDALSAYQAAQKVLEGLRVSLGGAVIAQASPHFELLQERQMRLAIEYNRINTLVERARVSRCIYKDSMQELERISEAVHEVRRTLCKSETALVEAVH